MLKILLVVFGFVLIQALIVTSEYVSIDEPECREDCSLLKTGEEKDQCLEKYMKFHSYKVVKSLFNFAKTAVFAGLWVNRYEKSDEALFREIFTSNLNNYNDPKVLGNLDFETLNKTAQYVYERFKEFTLKKEKIEELIPYASYPSLQCPTPCTYELLTWQSLFGVSLAIFVLCLITVSFYALFLKKHYDTLKRRLKTIKQSKSAES